MAGFRKKIKKNVPKVELHSIMSLVVGTYKTGKTRLWKEVTEEHYSNPDEALLLAFEKGYETWELENIIPVHEEGSDDTLWKVWEFFKKDIVNGLIEEAKEGRIVKLIGIDTADKCIDACTAWILNDRKKKYGKTFPSLQDISESTGGKENGWTALYDELKKPFDALQNAGYNFMVLGWTKERETTLYNGMKYNSIELMMPGTGRKVFESQASLICCLHNEVLIKDREGKELEDNLKDKKGKDRASNFHETKTMMYFRPSEYIGISGGRYTNLPDKVDYSAENYLKVFEEAVLGQLKKTNKSVDELKKEQEKVREEKSKEFVEKEIEKNNEINKDSLIEQIKVDGGQLKAAQRSKVVAIFKEKFDIQDVTKLQDMDKLQEALNIINDHLS